MVEVFKALREHPSRSLVLDSPGALFYLHFFFLLQIQVTLKNRLSSQLLFPQRQHENFLQAGTAASTVAMQPGEEFTSFVTSQQSKERQYFLSIMYFVYLFISVSSCFGDYVFTSFGEFLFVEMPFLGKLYLLKTF